MEEMISVLKKLSYGMYAVSAMDGQRPTGCIANTVFQITSQNPVVAVSLNKENYTYEVIQKTGRFSVSVLSEQTPKDVVLTLGFSSGRDKDKFDGLHYEMVDNLPVLLEESSGAITCDVISMAETETHMVILGRVAAAKLGSSAAPMTYDYYRTVVKGGTPKNAPSYVPVKEEPVPQGEVEYVCRVCGYVHKGPMDAEPDNYTCPICGVDKTNFKLKQ